MVMSSSSLFATNVAFQVAGGAANYFAAKSAAERKRKFQEVTGRLTRFSAEKSFRQGTRDLAIQATQDLDDTTSAIHADAIASQKAKATAKVAAAEAGVAGQSVDDLMRDFETVEMRSKAAHRTGLNRRDLARVGGLRQLQTARANQINSTRFGHVSDPSLAAHLLNTGANILSIMPNTPGG